MSLSAKGRRKAFTNPGASADANAGAISFGNRNLESGNPLSSEEMQIAARRIRRHVVSMIGLAGSGHPGGSLSAVEILTALYFRVLRHNPQNPHWDRRDRFVLSKGHAAPALYSILAESGYFPVEELSTLRECGSRLQGHCDMSMTPGVEISSGSLGQGLSFGIGMALAGRLDSSDHHVFVLLGDGECDEGQVWEAAMAAAHFRLDNITAIVDHNQQQIDGWNREVMNLEPLRGKWESFGWHVLEVDGHDIPQLVAAFETAKSVEGKPTAIIANTIKGKGVSFMENNLDFHGKAPTIDQVEKALEELR